MLTAKNKNKKFVLMSVTLAFLLIVTSLGLFADEGLKAGEKLKEKGIVAGDEKGDLKLRQALSRTELAVLLSRLNALEAEAKAYPYASSFFDEPYFPSWSRNYIAYAQYKAWFFGDNRGKFNPKNSVSGEEAAAVLLRILGYEQQKWGENTLKLKEFCNITIKNKDAAILRGELFTALWKALSEPVMKGGGVLMEQIELAKSSKHVSPENLYKDPAATKINIDANEYSVAGFSEDLAVCWKGHYYEKNTMKTGFINREGQFVIQPSESYNGRLNLTNSFSNGRAFFQDKGKYGYVDKSFKIVIPAIYDYVDQFRDGMAYVEQGKKWFYIDINGNVLFEGPEGFSAGSYTYRVIQNRLYYFKEGLAIVEDKAQKPAFIDKKGNIVIAPSHLYDQCGFFSDGRAVVKRMGSEGKDCFGYIDSTGKIVIDLKYSSAGDFEEGLALVAKGDYKNRTWGFIDKEGKEVIPVKYQSARDFHNGYAFVKPEGKYGGFIDKQGNSVSPIEFDHGIAFDGGFIVSKNHKFALMDKEMKNLTGYIFNELQSIDNSYFRVSIGEKYGIIDKNGNFIFQPVYDIAIGSDDGKTFVLKKDGEYSIFVLK